MVCVPLQASTGVSPVPTPSQPSSFDDTGVPSRANAHPLSPSFPSSANAFGRKSLTSQGMTSPGSSQHGAPNFVMATQPMGMMMGHGPRPIGASQQYSSSMSMPRSHDSHMMQPMQPHMMQQYMPQPHSMHMSPGGFGTMMMAPGALMMQPNGSYSGSMDQYIPMSGPSPSHR